MQVWCAIADAPPGACRYLMDLSAGEELPPLSGCALLTNAGPRKFMPTPQWFLEQGSPLRAARVFWCAACTTRSDACRTHAM